MIRYCHLLAMMALQSAVFAGELHWKHLPAIPDAIGFAGSFAGVLSEKLVVAGGANFPDRKPWEGGTKVWYDTIFRFNGKEWEKAGKLPRPLGYGVSFSIKEGMVIAGGSHASGHSDGVFLLRPDLSVASMPSLPTPCANLCGVMVGRSLYVAGGIEKPDATEAMKTFWRLDLDQLASGWQKLAPWPSDARMLATAATWNGEFYLIGGAALKAGADGKPERIWLTDGFAFSTTSGWRKLPKLDAPSVAAPSPAPVVDGHLLLVGGDDGAQLQVRPNEHRGFPKRVLKLTEDRWEDSGTIPVGLVTTSTTLWGGRWVVPGGEVRPGVRSTEVLALDER